MWTPGTKLFTTVFCWRIVCKRYSNINMLFNILMEAFFKACKVGIAYMMARELLPLLMGQRFVHDDVTKWKKIPRYWPSVRGIHQSPVNSPHKGLWRGALMFSLICARINGWVINRQAGELRRHRPHYDVILMSSMRHRDDMVICLHPDMDMSYYLMQSNVMEASLLIWTIFQPRWPVENVAHVHTTLLLWHAHICNILHDSLKINSAVWFTSGLNCGHYPTLGCDIQGFRAMGLSVQYWPRWFQDFRRSDWLCHSEQMGPIWGSVPCQKKNLLCVWNKLFLGEIKVSQGRTRPVKSLWWQIVPMQESANEWKI